jgi:acyl CoA:acetate/3-ketoacid CoA transferase beta subunit
MVTINLGIGIPTLVANYVRTDIAVEFQSEGVRHGSFSFWGEEDADIMQNKRSPLYQSIANDSVLKK